MKYDKQLFQVQNILDTLIEATDHFAALAKKKELNQSVYIFSSIVEGSQSIILMLNRKNKKLFSDHLAKLEKYLLMIANELEEQNFIKVMEIIQFSLRPQFINIRQIFINKFGNQQKEKEISIGVFNSWASPLKFYPKERINAMVSESVKQNSVLYFFSSQDVDFENNQIHADTYQSNNWVRVTVPFPDVINNVGVGRQTHTERKLRRVIPFTSFHVGNKYTLPKRMLKYRKFAELLVPFTVCINESTTYRFLEKHNRVVFKALGSNRGENIYFVTKKSTRFVILDQKKEMILNSSDFNQWIHDIILKEKGSYIIQKYIHTRTKDDEPYHFRAHVQKNGEGKWQLTHIYPRIGNKKTNLSNISTEGRVEDFPVFLREQYGEKQGALYEEKILKLSIDVSSHLDKLYGLALDELGLDFAIDDTGRIWMHEANNGPQTAYHEEKRAVNTIAYAKYIAENGIMYTDPRTQAAITKGQFQAKMTDILYRPADNQKIIGLLIGKQTEHKFVLELDKFAKLNHMILFQFTPKDIDYDSGLIRGKFLDNERWTTKIVEYPDMIIDYLKLRGKAESAFLYEELEDIPFTNEWAVYSNRQSSILDSLKGNFKSIPDFQPIKKLRHIFQFIEEYNNVQLKPEIMVKPAIAIQPTKDKNYLVSSGSQLKIYREIELRNYIEELLEKEAYIVCEDLRTQRSENTFEEIHIHLMKDAKNEWYSVTQYVEVEKYTEANRIETEQIDLTQHISSLYNTDNVDKLLQKIKTFSFNAASALEDFSETQIDELALILSIDENQEVKLIEINPNGPKTVYDDTALAKSTINSAESLILNK